MRNWELLVEEKLLRDFIVTIEKFVGLNLLKQLLGDHSYTLAIVEGLKMQWSTFLLYEWHGVFNLVFDT